jgi:hypothetical protein
VFRRRLLPGRRARLKNARDGDVALIEYPLDRFRPAGVDRLMDDRAAAVRRSADAAMNMRELLWMRRRPRHGSAR